MGAGTPSSPSLASPAGSASPDPAAVLATIPLPLVVIDARDRIWYVNSAAEQFFSRSLALLTRQALADIVPASSPLLTLIDQVRVQGASMQEYDIDVSTPRIGAHTVNAMVAPIREYPGYLLLVLQERSLADTISRQLTYRGSARSVSGMAAILAHEIKNPLAGIRGAAQLLEQQCAPDDVALTALIRKEADRICALVDRMEVFSDVRPIEPQPVNIHKILDHVRQIAEASFARDLTFDILYDPSLPDVLGDRDQLIQVFLNLVRNAADALKGMAGEGRITLTTAYRPGMRLSVAGVQSRLNLPLEVCVIDNGPGVPDDLKPHLFDPFVTTKSDGTGLGLALVAKIVGDHGGVIDCQSHDRQTCFRVLLPLQQKRGRS